MASTGARAYSGSLGLHWGSGAKSPWSWGQGTLDETNMHVSKQHFCQVFDLGLYIFCSLLLAACVRACVRRCVCVKRLNVWK